MKCIRCGQDIENDAPKGVTICGSCADDLRQEEEYQIMVAQEESINDQRNREAYEDAMKDEQRDTAQGYRYV